MLKFTLGLIDDLNGLLALLSERQLHSVSWRGCVAIYLADLVVNSREGGGWMLAVWFNGKCV